MEVTELTDEIAKDILENCPNIAKAIGNILVEQEFERDKEWILKGSGNVGISPTGIWKPKELLKKT